MDLKGLKFLLDVKVEVDKQWANGEKQTKKIIIWPADKGPADLFETHPQLLERLRST